MTSKVVYSNSNEICSLIESTCGWSLTPLDCLDDPDGPGGPLVLSTTGGGMDGLPALGKTSLMGTTDSPLLKARKYAYLFTNEWRLISYVKGSDKVLFRSILSPPIALEDRDCLLSTECLTFMMRQ